MVGIYRLCALNLAVCMCVAPALQMDLLLKETYERILQRADVMVCGHVALSRAPDLLVGRVGLTMRI